VIKYGIKILFQTIPKVIKFAKVILDRHV